MDAQVLWRHRQYMHAPSMQAVLERLGPQLRDLHHPPTKLKQKPPPWRFGEVLALLRRRGLLQELQVLHIRRDEPPPRVTILVPALAFK